MKSKRYALKKDPPPPDMGREGLLMNHKKFCRFVGRSDFKSAAVVGANVLWAHRPPGTARSRRGKSSPGAGGCGEPAPHPEVGSLRVG
jgi:hypothetical protein